MIDAFKTNGSSPPARRYRLKLATWTIAREPGQLLAAGRQQGSSKGGPGKKEIGNH
jgi:hypothetical protein